MWALALAAALAATAASAGPPAYLDDRSTAEAVVRSLYNAVDRGEHLRAWSYWDEDLRPDLDSFRDGYAGTGSVEVRVGEVRAEGAAGSTWWTVPVAVAARAGDGTVAVFAGCYTLSQPQPALQEAPPFRPIAIRDGHLRPIAGPLDQNVPASC